MTRIERIRNKSHELGKRYFPDANNVWARANIEAQYVSNACMEIAQWADRTMLDRACEWFEPRLTALIGREDAEELITAFRQAMKGE